MTKSVGLTLLLLVSGVSHAAPVSVDWQITTQGFGPGIENATKSFYWKLTACAGCSGALNLPAACNYPAETNLTPAEVFDESQIGGWQNCGYAQNIAGMAIRDAVAGPASLTWSSAYPVWAVTSAMAGITVPGVQTVLCGSAAGSGTWSGSATGGPIMFLSRWNIGYETGQLNCFTQSPMGSCIHDQNNFKCQSPVHSWTADVTYRRQSATAPKTCSQSGAKFIEPDAAWHLVASATCMTAPDTATSWSCSVSLSGTLAGAGTTVEGVMTNSDPASLAKPYPSGPQLWVRATLPPFSITIRVLPGELHPWETTAPDYALATVHVVQGGNPAAGKTVKLTCTARSNPGHSIAEHSEDRLSARTGAIFESSECTTDESGDCSRWYKAADAAAEVEIKAALLTATEISDTATVQIGLPLAQFPGGPGITLTGSKPGHPNNHFIDPVAIASLAGAGADFFKKAKTVMRLNEISIERGGLLDIDEDWVPPHFSHRLGRDVDIENLDKLDVLELIMNGHGWKFIDEGQRDPKKPTKLYPHFRWKGAAK